jgi:hypothetical protein
VVDVGVGEDHGVEFLRGEAEAAVQAEALLPAPLDQAAVEEEAVPVELEEVAASRDAADGAVEREFHEVCDYRVKSYTLESIVGGGAAGPMEPSPPERPHVARITEADPRRLRIHVRGEMHPGELAARGYERRGEEWVLEIRRPGPPAGDPEPLEREFRALRDLGYGFAEGMEWAPAELFRKYLGKDRWSGGR